MFANEAKKITANNKLKVQENLMLSISHIFYKIKEAANKGLDRVYVEYLKNDQEEVLRQMGYTVKSEYSQKDQEGWTIVSW